MSKCKRMETGDFRTPSDSRRIETKSSRVNLLKYICVDGNNPGVQHLSYTWTNYTATWNSLKEILKSP